MRSGLSQIRIANVRPPRMSARCTPLIALSFGWTPRVLPDAQRPNRLHARNHDDEVDDNREDRPLDEEIGESHQLFSGLGFASLPGLTLLLTRTAAPLRSLNTPELTTSSPGLRPDR